MTEGDELTDRERRLRTIIETAQKDPAFKQKLLDDPKAAAQEALGVAVPEGIELEVLQESPTKIYLVLPANEDDVELSDEALEQAAGGGWDPCWSTCD